MINVRCCQTFLGEWSFVQLFSFCLLPTYFLVISCVPPLQAANTFYPNLCSFSSFDEITGTNLPLSRKSMVGAGNAILLVDAIKKVIVYYGPTALDLPRPTKDCRIPLFTKLFFFHNIDFISITAKLEVHLSTIKTNKQFVPQVQFLKCGTQEASKLEELLIEDESTLQDSGLLTQSWKAFMQQQATEAAKELKEHK